MAKYDPLRTYLKRQSAIVVEMSFREIENMIGALLPKGAERPEWWLAAASPPTVQSRA